MPNFKEQTAQYLACIEEYFDNTKVITIKDFKLSLDALQAIHVNEGGQISQKYSIKLANGRSGTDFVEFKPYTLTFETNKIAS